ncbi:formate/nitrite transporter family protein [Sphingosinicellaceae bacterium]|nr:formate/nitrite transporter family protein [Sphingosinicellaceae bacterium]
MARQSQGRKPQAAPPTKGAAPGTPASKLSPEEEREVDKRGLANPRIVHEVVRLQGEEELDRGWTSLVASGVAAGVSISASVLAKAFLLAGLPKDAAWTPLVAAFGYTVGFVIVIMGRLQLFTETTVTAVLPVATQPTLANLGRLGRLWGLVLVANLTGSLFVAFLIAKGLILSPEHRTAVLELSRAALAHDVPTLILLGIPAGFLVASIAWILPNAQGQEIWIIILITWVVGIGDFSHVVAGSTEAFVLWCSGEIGFGQTFGGFILPALLGNIIGGTGLFAVLAHGTVRGDL